MGLDYLYENMIIVRGILKGADKSKPIKLLKVTWDGLDERGEEISSGIYLYRLFVSKIEFSQPRKLVLMK